MGSNCDYKKRKGTVQGPRTHDYPNLSSYRAESQGCKGALLLLNKFDMDTPRVLLCVNMSAIQSLNKLRNHLPNVNQSDYNILLEIK
jgi:hypothetical protein